MQWSWWLMEPQLVGVYEVEKCLLGGLGWIAIEMDLVLTLVGANFCWLVMRLYDFRFLLA